MKRFADDIIEKFPGEEDLDGKPGGRQLDCLINNAATFDENGPKKNADGSLDLTFMVNAFAPFIMVKKILTGMRWQPQRIINTSSISHIDAVEHHR